MIDTAVDSISNALGEGRQFWPALLLSCLGTYFCRVVGVWLSGRIDQASEFFYWLTAVTYAMVAAMTVKMIFLPSGPVSTVPVYIRLLICIISVSVLLAGTKRRLGPALLIGILCLWGYVNFFIH